MKKPLQMMISFVALSAIYAASQTGIQSGTTGLPSSISWKTKIGQEVSVPVHLQDGREYSLQPSQLVAFGQLLFNAMWTSQEGAGRPFSKGTGSPISDPNDPLVFPRNFNRISAPDSNSCSGCHNKPVSGGGGDIVANVFVLGQRFDFVTFSRNDGRPTKGSVDESGSPVSLETIADSRKTIGMFGSGYIEMLARQITADLQAIRDRCAPGQEAILTSKGIGFGVIAHRADGFWDTSRVVGIPAPSLGIASPVVANAEPEVPSLIIRPFHQAGNVISIRQFTNNAFNHHHGMQAEERFGIGVDADGDGFVNELTRADVTAVSVFQATMAVPGRVIPRDQATEHAIHNGEAKFDQIGCTSCHMSSLPLISKGWMYTEPNPYNPPGNLRTGDAPPITIDLNSPDLPQPRLQEHNGVTMVPAYTDLKLHRIYDPGSPDCESLDMNQSVFTPNCAFLTSKLWGLANQFSFGHHGKYTTMREAVLAHSAEARLSRVAFQNLSAYDRDSIIEFLKSLQILPPNTKSMVVDEYGNQRSAKDTPVVSQNVK
jgi:hypothetical protein